MWSVVLSSNQPHWNNRFVNIIRVMTMNLVTHGDENDEQYFVMSQSSGVKFISFLPHSVECSENAKTSRWNGHFRESGGPTRRCCVVFFFGGGRDLHWTTRDKRREHHNRFFLCCSDAIQTLGGRVIGVRAGTGPTAGGKGRGSRLKYNTADALVA